MVKAILAHKSFFLKNSTALNIFSDICIQQIEYTKLDEIDQLGDGSKCWLLFAIFLFLLTVVCKICVVLLFEKYLMYFVCLKPN